MPNEHQPLRECVEFRVRHEQEHKDRDRRIDEHIYEAVKDGGHRDQLRECVAFICALRSALRFGVLAVFIISLLGGVIGGLLGRESPKIGEAVAHFLIGMGD